MGMRGGPPESLGVILQRIQAKYMGTPGESTPRHSSGLTAEKLGETEQQCQKCSQGGFCNGFGWVSHTVPLDHPDFGEAFPCPKCCPPVDIDAMMVERFSATFPHKKDPRTWENFQKDSPFRTKLFDQVWAWAEDPNKSNLLVLAGPHGTGKSHLLEALGRGFNASGIPTQYHNMSRLMVTFRAELGNKPPDLDKHYRMLAQPELLILDDITEYGTDYSAQVLTEILEPRYYGRGLLALATNLDKVSMAEIWGYRLADRIFDEDSGDTELVYSDGPSYRSGTTWQQMTRTVKKWRRG